MNKFLELYDRYDLRVRMSVAIIVLIPIIMSFYLIIPEVRSLSFTAIIIIILFGISNLIISISRYYGRDTIKKCFNGILPAQQMLHPDDTTLDEITKKRYQYFFSSKIDGISFKSDTQNLDAVCNTSINWIISQTRDSNQFPVIKEELINFGFAKNLYGVKSLGIIVTITVIILDMIIFFLQYHYKTYIFNNLNIVVSLILSFCILIMWIFIINKKWVIECGRNYAKALLSACDSPYLNK